MKPATHVGGLLVVVVVWYVPRQAEVSDLQHFVVSDENVSCCQVAMYALQTTSTTHSPHTHVQHVPPNSSPT